MNEVKTVELFAGIGGFRLGLEQANSMLRPIQQQNKRQYSNDSQNKLGKWQPDGFRVIWANEWDKYACQIYRKNFGEKELCEGDIRKIDTNDIPDVDLIVGGFPCQPFSLAGKRHGFSDTRGTLFNEILRIAKAKQPKMLFLENVKGLLSHNNGDTFETILRALGDAGYWWEYKVLNSQFFGVPQRRERVFIIGHLREGCTRQVFPIGESVSIPSTQSKRQCREGQGLRSCIAPTLRATYHKGYETRGPLISTTIDARYGALRNSGEPYIVQVKRTRADGNHMIREYEGQVPTLTSQMGTGGGNVPLVAQALQTDSFLRSGSSFGTDKPQSSRNIRRLTPTECERLQGFPDGWTEGVSDTQRYKCLGNAVTVNVIQAIGELILEAYVG